MTVEWLVRQLDLNIFESDEEVSDVIQKAKEMELEKLKEAYSMGRMNKSIKEFNETFKSE